MKIFLKQFYRSIWLGITIFVVMLVIAWSQGHKPEWDIALVIQFVCVMGYTMVLHLANTGVFVAMDRIFNNKMSVKRLVAGFVCSFVVSLFAIFLLRIFEDVVVERKTVEEYFREESIANYYVAMVITLIITLSVHAIHFYRKFQENRVKQQKIIAGTASAKFETLKNQIDPHFLFNSLNVLSSLIEENPDMAQRFTTSLSKIYRYVLEQKDKELVSVQEELSFAKTYMNLLKMRFENSVFYEVAETEDNPDAKVVPLSLQLLLENTIKHNVVSQQRPLYIRIFEEDGYLVVQNDYQRKEVLQDRKGVGLENIVNRYDIITNRKVHIEQTEKHFTVKLPILTKQVAIMETIPDNNTESSYYKAQKKVEDIKGFYGNLASYCVIITGLMILNLVTSPQHLWFLYPAVGWGIGVAIHAVTVFNYMPFLGRDWEERKIQELMDKEKTNKWK